MRSTRLQSSRSFIGLSLLLLAGGFFLTSCSEQPQSIISPVPQEDAALSASLAKAAGGGRVFIVFDDAADPGLVESLGGQVVYSYHLVPAVAATGPASVFSELAGHPRVVRIEPDGEVQAIDAELDNTWGAKHIGAGAVHAGGNKGTGVKVGILDSGIDYTHPDLDANYAGGYDFVNNDTDPMDDNGHGTHVAGTVAAEDNNAGVVGVASEASLYALKVLSASGSGSWSDIIAALQWAVDNGIQVTNNSYGSSLNPGSTVKAAFDNSAAAGILHVAAAGNSGNPRGKGNNVGYPARFESVIAVAATDQNDSRASFSSTGSAVELAAPGVAINSTKLGGGYVEFNGTSMASPHVAGTAALVIAAGITDANGDGNINDEVRQRLDETADDLGDPGRDPLYGYGLVDADEAADLGPPNDPPTVSITSPADGSSFDPGATVLFEGSASDTEDGDLTASLVWTSNIDGQIGARGSFSTTLSDGDHTITAEVTDSGGKTGNASVNITVGNPPAQATTVSVSSITYATGGGKNNDKHLLITVALVDDLGNPVSGASVSIDLSRDGSPVGSGTSTTGSDGTVTFSLKNARPGCYTTTVTNVTASGLTWDGVTPANEFCK
ncbi:MAG: S8 family serine peptidase [Candidatus Marinimicrobia bacterium]|nr:S8 family serine peptidase [Candidatus Neomarinimicrobiota bacterium]